MSHIWMGHVTHQQYHKYGWVMSRQIDVLVASQDIQGLIVWVISHIWMGHVTHQQYHTYGWVMSHQSRCAHCLSRWSRCDCVSHVTHVNRSCYISTMSHVRVSHVTSKLMCLLHLKIVKDMVGSHMNGSCHTWAMSNVRMGHVTSKLMCAWPLTIVKVWLCESCHTCEWVMSHMSHVTHESCHTEQWIVSHLSQVTHTNE